MAVNILNYIMNSSVTVYMNEELGKNVKQCKLTTASIMTTDVEKESFICRPIKLRWAGLQMEKIMDRAYEWKS